MAWLDVLLIVITSIISWRYWRLQRDAARWRDALDTYAAEASDLSDRLKHSEARAAALANGPLHPILILNAAGHIVAANTRAISWLGPGVIDQTVIEATRSHEIDDVVQTAIETRQPHDQPVTWNARPYYLRAVPIERGGAVVVLEDQTELQRLERVRRDFVANVSHELRTPLASIRLLIETLLAGAKDDPEVAGRMLNQAIGEVDTLTQLAQELLDLSLIEAGQMPMQIARARLREVVEEQVQHFTPQAQQKRITLNNQVSDELHAEIDRKLIGRVLGNLLHNAIKFAPIEGQIAIGATAATDKITVSIADTGPGIPPEDLPRIFERFYKVDRARGTGGTGLGLAIARHVVEAHGGRIWAESVMGKGATFYFTVPVAH